MGTVRLDADALGALEHHLPVLQAHLQDVVSSGVALGHSTLMKTKRVVSDYHYYARLIILSASSKYSVGHLKVIIPFSFSLSSEDGVQLPTWGDN